MNRRGSAIIIIMEQQVARHWAISAIRFKQMRSPFNLSADAAPWAGPVIKKEPSAAVARKESIFNRESHAETSGKIKRNFNEMNDL